jgi:hypothetical protein
MSTEEYEAAGCAFTDGKLILAGYQPNKPQPFISGLGGAKAEGETPFDTALRETLEELFEVQDPPQALLSELEATLTPSSVLQNGTYIMFVFSFADLEAILRLAKLHIAHTKMYSTFPETLVELVFGRQSQPEAEISHLVLLPLVRHDSANPFVSADFLQDITALSP